MSEFQIRPAVPADLPRVKVLGKVLEKSAKGMTPAYLQRLYFTTSMPDAYWLDFINGRTGFLLVCQTEEIVGMAVVQTHGAVAHLQQVVVLSACRRRGYGRALVEAAMEEAQSLGKTAFTLNVLEGNEAAKRLYETVGFAPYRTFYTKQLEQVKNDG